LDDQLKTVVVDKNEMKQVIINLTRNAVEAMGHEGMLEISTTMDEHHVLIAVSDTGPGISEDRIPKLFNSFYTTKQEGTGLGLTICKGIVNKYSGTITVQSIVGDRTTFTVKFPLLDVDEG